MFSFMSSLRKEMPTEPIPGMEWLMPKLVKDLTESKMWPIKLASVKHQEALCTMMCIKFMMIMMMMMMMMMVMVIVMVMY